jgi:hypothetical protein
VSEEFLIAAAAATLEGPGGNEAVSSDPHGCQNCGAALAGPFCHACGQKRTHLHKPVWELIEDFLETILHFDGRIWQTLRALFLRPGQMTLDWIEGRQMRHVPPIRLFIFTTLLLVASLAISDVALVRLDGQIKLEAQKDRQVTHFSIGVCTDEKSKDCVRADTKAGMDVNNNIHVSVFQLTPKVKSNEVAVPEDLIDQIGSEKDRKITASLMDFANEAVRNPRVLNHAITGSITTFVLLATPVMALLLKLFYIRRKKFLAEHVYFALHVHTFFFAALLVCILLVWASRGWLGGWNMLLALWLAYSLYFLIALRRVYTQGWGKTFVKSMLVTGFYLITLVAIGTTLLTRTVTRLAE